MTEVGAVIIGGDFQGLGILRSLGARGVPIHLLDSELSIGRFSRYGKKFERCPRADQEDSLIEFLKDLAEREDVEGWVVYPTNDETVCLLAKHKDELERSYRIPTPSWDIVKFAHVKRLTYEVAERAGIAVPRTVYPESVEELDRLGLEFPVIIKPSVKEPFYREIKKKAIRANNREELMEGLQRALSVVDISQIMVQELIQGGPRHLFSVGSLFKDGDFLGKVVARRIRQHPMDFGHATTFAETVDLPELEEIARKILGLIGYYGLSEVEFMLDPSDGKYKLIEINPRTWGWHTLAIGAGVDLPYMLYRDMLGDSVRQNGFDKDTRWIRLTTDIPTAAGEMLKGNLKVREYLGSFRGRKQFAVLSLRDPLPFVMELLMIPYLWKKRGF